MKIRLLLPALLACLCCACVTNIRPDVAGNPPPSEPFANFQRFELAPLQVDAGAAHETDAIAKISLYMRERPGATLSSWNGHGPGVRLLKVEPRIVQLKFVGGGARFFAGAMAGSSAVLMRVRFVDAQTGKVVADPEFYQRASAYGGAWSVGGTDNGMLARIATVVDQYLQRNYGHAVGGPTGLEGSPAQ